MSALSLRRGDFHERSVHGVAWRFSTGFCYAGFLLLTHVKLKNPPCPSARGLDLLGPVRSMLQSTAVSRLVVRGCGARGVSVEGVSPEKGSVVFLFSASGPVQGIAKNVLAQVLHQDVVVRALEIYHDQRGTPAGQFSSTASSRVSAFALC